MNNVEIFNSVEFGRIRVAYIDKQPWFVAGDLSKSLGYKSLDRMYRHIDKEDKININPQNKQFQGSHQNGGSLEPNKNITRMILINESGLYSSIFGSTLNSAKQFKRWVTSEVLPSIRKHGVYMLPEVLHRAVEDEVYRDYIISLLDEDAKRKKLITKDSVSLDKTYKQWTNTVVSPLLYELQLYHPKETTSHLLDCIYKAMIKYDDINVYDMREKFIESQMDIAHDNEINDIDEYMFRIPYLYVVYMDEAAKATLLYELSYCIKYEIQNAKEQQEKMNCCRLEGQVV